MKPKDRSVELAWIPVGELAKAFASGSYILPPATDLVGKRLNLYFEDGRVSEYTFETTNKLHCSVVSGAGRTRDETYSGTEVREGVYFVDYVNHLERATSVSLVLDLNVGIFTAVIGQLPTRFQARKNISTRSVLGRELTSVVATFLSGSINKPFSKTKTPRHGPTNELLGKRVEYTYSPTERYEHLYLNENFYTWHCLAGAEKGLADTDRCYYYKLSDKLYLFVWREKIVPTLGVLIEDFDQMKTSGKIFGYKGNDFRALSNFQVGAKARILY